MANFPWCRLYNDILSDRKIERVKRMTHLPRVVIRGAFTSMMAMANDSPDRGALMWSGGIWVTEEEICDDLEMDRSDFDGLLLAFEALEMITRLEHGGLRLTNFDKRQYKSDLSTKRVQAHRARKAKEAQEVPDPASYGRNVPAPVPETLQETLPQRFRSGSETETDVTETEIETEEPPIPVALKISPGPLDPEPNPEMSPTEIAAWLAKPDPALMLHWPTLRAEMEAATTRQIWADWLGELKPLAIKDHLAFMCHPTAYGQEWCTARLKPLIDRTVRSIVPNSMGSAIVTDAPPGG